MTQQHAPLLVEIGTEELPPKSLKTFGQQFANNFVSLLQQNQFEAGEFQWFASPRRLAVLIDNVSGTQPDTIVEKRGPAVSAAFDENGEPTKAALGWARGNGISLDQASRLKTDKGEWLLHKVEQKGKTLGEEISGLIKAAVAKLPIPKPMRWADEPHQFVRPVHTLCVLQGDNLLPATLFDIPASATIRGHRFHGEATFKLENANAYESALLAHNVVASFSGRVDTIRTALDNKAAELGLTADYDTGLLDEIAALVEWPQIMSATFEEAFLAVPKEALIYTMKDDQKYVPLLDSNGALANTFLFVSNIASKTPEKVVEGNQKVIRPRLADAEFFYNTDKKQPLSARFEKLETVLFQKQLGTLKDKVERLALTSGKIASLIGADAELASRAGLLSKADLVTNMVMEFPEVQGVMGKYYALNDNEHPAVAEAIECQYLPKFAGDALPTNPVSISVALAEKLDTLVGIFGIGQKPKGDKDPFALRRAAIGVIRLLVETDSNVDLSELVGIAAQAYKPEQISLDEKELVDFILTRFGALLKDQGIPNDAIQAVAKRRPTRPLDFANRVKAVNAFRSHDSAEALFAANKRVANILNKNPTDSDAIKPSLFAQTEESNLHQALTSLTQALEQQNNAMDYTATLSSLASLREPLDAFFDQVMVMADDTAVRQNRLALLSTVRQQFLSVADISVMVKS